MKKTIGIIVAMEKELDLLLPLLSDIKIENWHGVALFYVGKVGENEVVITQCGIGKVNAAIGATIMLSKYWPAMVLNTGVGAGVSDNVNVMDVVMASYLAHHDVWCLGEEWGVVPGLPGLLPAALFNNAEHLNVKVGLIVTGEKFIESVEEVNQIKEHFPEALAVDMESAAIAQTCYQFGTAFMCLRVISDTPWVGHDNSAQYANFWADVPQKTFSIVKDILTML